MFWIFKNKMKMKVDAFNQGYDQGRRLSERLWRYRYKELEKEAQKAIEEKNKKNRELVRDVNKIKTEVERFILGLREMHFIGTDRRTKETKRIIKLVEEKQAIRREIDELDSMFRKATQSSEKISEKIEKFEVRAIGT